MRIHPAFRFGTLTAAAAAATLLAAGCGSNGTASQGGSGHSAEPVTMSAAQVIANVSGQAKRATSATVIMDMRSTGKTESTMHGVMKMRTSPDLATELDLTELSSGGQTVPGGMTEIITSKGAYMKMAALAQATGKQWVFISAKELNNLTGGAFNGISQSMGEEDPISAARMLGASKDAKVVGKATINGVQTTHYTGTFTVQDAVNLVAPKARPMVREFESMAGVSDIHFDLYVDNQFQPRELVENFTSTLTGNTTMTMQFTSFNQPVTITPPPASEVGALPGMG